jgi:DNA-binding MarR family transcriptional regulator
MNLMPSPSGYSSLKLPATVTDSPADFGGLIEQRVATGLVKIGLALKSQSWQDAGQQGLTPTQGQILALLQAREPAGLRLSEIAEGLAVTPATASEAVSVLVEKGLVAKVKSAQDKRAIAITLTDPGKQQAVQVSCWSDFLLGAVAELDEAEQGVFLKGLIKIIRKLQDQGRIPIAHMCVNCQFFQPDRYTDAERPHHCAFVDAAFGDRQLQIDCPDHVAQD